MAGHTKKLGAAHEIVVVGAVQLQWTGGDGMPRVHPILIESPTWGVIQMMRPYVKVVRVIGRHRGVTQLHASN